MKPFTVLLLRPDYFADPYGQDTFLAHVEADDAEHAVELVRERVAEADSADEPNDYYVLFMCEGHVEDVTPAEEFS